MKWVTREKAKVDRVACPWLIKRFVDKDAEFLFVPEDKVMEVAEKEGAIPFDVKGVELGHHGDECTFDAIIKKYKLEDPALKQLALVVRGADTPNRSLTPESAGLNSIAEGFRLISKDDYDNLAKQFPLYDALYAYFKSKTERR
ncbi:MAG: chromate resistance protein [Candidatus Brockarchaeota archaeon]|nr:chromate resistance protein [Candidatus Brockarchaeota archaeon]